MNQAIYMESPCNDYLPSDVILEILLRLPVKTLLRFKCVCKQWCTLIRSPTFVNQHFSHKSNPEGLLIWHYDTDEKRLLSALYADECGSGYEEPDHPKMPDGTLDIFGPLSGVFCVVNKSRQRRVALFNPAMRQFRPIPSHALNDDSNLNIYEHVRGFGLDPLSGDYTVVSIRSVSVRRTRDWTHYVCIYNSGRDSWRYIENMDLSTKLENFKSDHSICLDGVQYWKTHTNNVDNVVSILALDTNENFQEIQVPDCVKYKGIVLVQYGDSIALLTFDLPSTDQRISIWVMKEVGCWTKTFTFGPIEGLYCPIFLWKSTELLLNTEDLKYLALYNVSIADSTYLALYNVSTGILRKIEVCGRKGSTLYSKCGPYKDSLVSIKGDGDSCMLWDTSSHFVKDWFQS